MIRPTRSSRTRAAAAHPPCAAPGGRATEPAAAEARTYCQRGDPKAAAPGTRSAKLLILLGKGMLQQGQFQRVLDELSRAPQCAGRPAILALRGCALLGLQRHVEAGALFDTALEGDPGLPAALLGLARIAFADQQPRQAAVLAARALAAHPADLDCLRFRADLLRIDGQPEAALAAHRAILTAHPDDAQARVDVASLLTDQGRLAEARAQLQAARQISPGNLSLMYAQAMLDYRAARYHAASASLQQLLRVAPDYYPAVLLLGAVGSACGANRLAERQLRRFLDAYPGHLHASKLMSALHMRANRCDAALALIAPLLAQHGADADLLRTAKLLAMHYLRTSEPDKAQVALDAMTRQGASAQLHNLKGGVLLARDDVPAARACFERALALDPLHLPALDNLAQLDLLAGRVGDAMQRYRDALQRAPHSLPLLEALARLARHHDGGVALPACRPI